MAITHTNWYSTNGQLGASSSGAGSLLLEYGFAAVGLRLYNACGIRLFYNLAGVNATTANAYLTSGAVLQVDGADAGACGLGLVSTSTSTAVGSTPQYALTAWASA